MSAETELWMQSRGREAMSELWALAHDGQASAQQRERLLIWFAEQANGKARIMDAPQAGADGRRTGVVILPAVMAAPEGE